MRNIRRAAYALPPPATAPAARRAPPAPTRPRPRRGPRSVRREPGIGDRMPPLARQARGSVRPPRESSARKHRTTAPSSRPRASRRRCSLWYGDSSARASAGIAAPASPPAPVPGTPGSPAAARPTLRAAHESGSSRPRADQLQPELARLGEEPNDRRPRRPRAAGTRRQRRWPEDRAADRARPLAPARSREPPRHRAAPDCSGSPFRRRAGAAAEHCGPRRQGWQQQLPARAAGRPLSHRRQRERQRRPSAPARPGAAHANGCLRGRGFDGLSGTTPRSRRAAAILSPQA